MPKPHWFPFYVQDFLSSPTVAIMTAEEVGGYCLLLCYAWQDPRGSLPNDDDSLRILSRVKGDLVRIKSCFNEKNGRIYNVRLTQELDKALEKSDSARKSNAMRWQSERKANVKRTRSSSQSQSQSESEPELQSESELQSQKEMKTCMKATPSVLKVSKTGPTWMAYRTGYIERYQTPPICNAKVNGQLSQVVNRLGAESAPQVALFYLRHNEPFYVRSRHSVNFLLRDCEGLHTQMVTGVKSTTGEARNAERNDDAREQVKRVEVMLKRGTL